MTELEGWNFEEGSVISCDDSMYTFFFFLLLVLCWAFTFSYLRHVHVYMDLHFFWYEGLKDF